MKKVETICVVGADKADQPSPAIVERFARDEYGKKSGKGFYKYNK